MLKISCLSKPLQQSQNLAFSMCSGVRAEKYIHEIFLACYYTVQYIPMNPVAGIIGGTPFTIMGTRAPIAIGTGGTIPIVGMPNKECRKKEK